MVNCLGSVYHMLYDAIIQVELFLEGWQLQIIHKQVSMTVFHRVYLQLQVVGPICHTSVYLILRNKNVNTCSNRNGTLFYKITLCQNLICAI